MRAKAVLMALAMMTTALAGCTGTDGVTEVDEDALNELIQDNLQDFINNTTVIVNQDFHYHNNTTYVVDDGDYSTNVVNEYNNTTNVEGSDVHNYNANNYSIGGGGANGNGTGGTLYLLDIQFSLADLMPDWAEIDHRNNTIDVWWEYYDYLANEYRNDLFTIYCSDYYLIGSQSANSSNSYSYWQSSSNYQDAWENQYNQTIADMLEHYAYDSYQDNSTGETGYHVREACDEDYSSDGGFDHLHLFDIPIPEGVAIAGVYDGYFQGIEEYVWSPGGSHYNCAESYINYNDWSWREQYYPLCPNADWSHNAFSYGFEFETIQWSFTYGGWVGGDSDSVLSVSVSNIYPGWEYRLIAYFHMSPVLALE